jgi:hypothetical protein
MTTATLPADKFDKSLTFVRPATPPQRVPLDNLKVLPGFNTRVKDEEYAERFASRLLRGQAVLGHDAARRRDGLHLRR